MPDFIDPYTYPDSTVLRNRFNIRDHDELGVAETEASWVRRQQIAEGAVTGNFDLSHLQALHRWLFQDVFDWAGQLRTVNISKGTSFFLPAGSILTGAEYTFGGDSIACLRTGAVSDEEFLDATTELLGSINFIHPFREGNGRTQRVFLDQLAAHGGRELAWRNATEDENIEASAASVADPSTPLLRELITKVMRPPRDGLSILDAGVYQVGPPTTATGEESTDGLEALRRFRRDI